MSVDRRAILMAAAAASLYPRMTRAAGPTLAERPAWGAYFNDIGTAGVLCFTQGDAILTSNPARAGQGFLPESTFKICNALIALETGVSSPDERFEWDGTERGLNGKPIAAWNKSQTLREAFRNSTIWIYQEIARRVGSERMAGMVATFDYGNGDISGAPIDQFWLVSDSRLRISAVQQIDFLQRLWAGSLPAKPAAMAMVREIMLIEREAGTALCGKTGWGRDHGWIVGVLETDGVPRAFALNLDHHGSDAFAPQRMAIVKRAARDLKLL
jgi:beta-lactamase class D